MLLDQYGNPFPGDPLVAALWSRALAREVKEPGLLGGPRIVDQYGEVIASEGGFASIVERGAFRHLFLSPRHLDGTPLIEIEDEDG